jgi:hypothetical protein
MPADKKPAETNEDRFDWKDDDIEIVSLGEEDKEEPDAKEEET